MPRELSNVHRSRRMALAVELHTWCEHEGCNFLKCIVTGDKRWFHYWTPECKEKLRLWKTVEVKAPCKFKEQPSTGKILSTVFWDYQGVIMIEYSPLGRTVTEDMCFNTLMHLWQAIKEKRCEKEGFHYYCKKDSITMEGGTTLQKRGIPLM